ncbi:MAG: nucleotidyltransferase family protein [Bdellovibrionales bacterium]
MSNAFTTNFDHLPQSVQKVVTLIQEKLTPKKIILFGSRARGDARENSDYDLCVVGAASNSIRSQVRLLVDEEPLTLFKIDLLFYEDLAPDYLENIKKEGLLLYG